MTLKIWTLYFFWFIVSRLFFVTFYLMFQDYYFFYLVQCFKTFLLSYTQKSICISLRLFHFYSFIYTCPQPSMSSHPKYTQIKKKKCHLPSSLQPYNDTNITPTLSYHLILTCMSRLWLRKGACFFIQWQ